MSYECYGIYTVTVCPVEVLDFAINVRKAKGFHIVAMSLYFGYKSTSQSLQ